MLLRQSIRAGLENRSEAMAYAMEFSRGLEPHLADRFVGMYVNELTEDYGDEGRQAVRELLRRKQQGEKIEAPKEHAPAKVINLMDALRRSVEAERGGAKKVPAASVKQRGAKKKPARATARHRRAS